MVLIPESVVSSEATRLCPPSVMPPLERHATCCRMDSENCFSATSRTLSCCWWTTEPTAVRSPTPSPPRPGKFAPPWGFFVLRFLVLTPLVHRKVIVQRAKELNVRLTNGTAKLKKQSNEWHRSPHTQVSSYRLLQKQFLGGRVAVPLILSQDILSNSMFQSLPTIYYCLYIWYMSS